MMKRNPNYRGEPYPCEGMPGDKEAGLLDDCGKPTPFIDTLVVSTIEKRGGAAQRASSARAIYDVEVFERTDTGVDYLVEMQDSEEVRARIPEARASSCRKLVDVNSWFIGFNMLDPVIGNGGTPEQSAAQPQAAPGDRRSPSTGTSTRKIFPKKAGETAMSPLPAGHLRLAPRHARGRQPGDPQGGGRQASCAARSTTPRS